MFKNCSKFSLFPRSRKQGTDRGKGRAAAELLDAQMAALEKMMAEQQCFVNIVNYTDGIFFCGIAD